MNYVQAVEAPERNIGQIKLYDRAEAFAGMIFHRQRLHLRPRRRIAARVASS